MKSNFRIEVTDDGSVIQVHLWHDGQYVAQISPLDDGPGVVIVSAVPARAGSDVEPSWSQYTTTVRIP